MTAVQQSILNKNRKDKFLLVLNLPPILKRSNKIDQNDRASKYINLDSLQYSIHGTVVPKSTISEVELAFSGQTTKITSYNRTSYEAVTVNFTVDNEFSNWWLLWYWLSVINDSKEGKYNYNKLSDTSGFTNLTNYQTNITVYGLDEYNNKKIQWDYTNAFITGVEGIVFNYQNPEQMDSSFTFAFSQLQSQLL